MSRGDFNVAAKRLELLNNVSVLEITLRVEELTKRLLSVGLVPASVASDAIHIATASVYGMDFLLTRNFKHIAKPHIQAALREEVAFFGERFTRIEHTSTFAKKGRRGHMNCGIFPS